jgi:hypothetical protein
MPRLAVAFLLLGIVSFFISIEILLRPEIFQPVEPVEEVSQKRSFTEKESTVKNPLNREEVLNPEVYFDLSSLERENITLHKGKISLALFQHAPIVVERDSFYLATFVFHVDKNPIGTVSRVIPTYNTNSGRLLSLVRQKLRSVIPLDEQGHLMLSRPLNTIGEANFYLNDQGNFPNTIFLVTRSEAKVLAFQYPSEYHSLVKKNIPLFFR